MLRRKGFLLGAILLLFVGVGVISYPEMRADAKSEKDSAAITIKLAKTEGNKITIKNSSGKSVKIRDNMRVYSGYEIETKAKSYVYFYLDDTKAIKLDQNTKVTVKKQGGKNELYVSNGKIFFNVTKKLKSTEKVTIKTSNITMGIRGTCGTVAEDGQYAHIYEGTGYVSYTEAGSSVLNSVTIPAGQGVAVTDEKVQVGAVSLDQIPAFTLTEFLTDDALFEKVSGEMKLTKSEVEKQKEINEAAEEKQINSIIEEAEKQEEEIRADGGINYTVIDKMAADNSRTRDSASEEAVNDEAESGITDEEAVIESEEAYDDDEEYDYAEEDESEEGSEQSSNPIGGWKRYLKLPVNTMLTQSMLDMAFFFQTRVVLSGSGEVQTVGNLKIPKNRILAVPDGITLTIRETDTVTNQGRILNYSKQSIKNNGTLVNESSGKITNVGKLDNIAGTVNNYGVITNQRAGEFISSGTINNHKTIQNNGQLLNLGELMNQSKIKNNGTFNNCGNLNQTSGSVEGKKIISQWKVTFMDSGNKVLKEEYVTRGAAAVPPEIKGTFTGWSEDFGKIEDNKIVYATTDALASYQLNGHSIASYEIEKAYEEAAKAKSEVTLYTKPEKPVEWKFTNKEFVLDLGGLTLKNIRITVEEGAELTIKNGTVNGFIGSEGDAFIVNHGSLSIIGTKINYKKPENSKQNMKYYGIYTDGKLITEDMNLNMEDSFKYGSQGRLYGVYMNDGTYTAKRGTAIDVKGSEDTLLGMSAYGLYVNGGDYTIDGKKSEVTILPNIQKK